MKPVCVAVPNKHHWLRVASSNWSDPVDCSYARTNGGRWNVPGSHNTLYLSMDVTTARAQVARLAARHGYDVDDLADDADYLLVSVTLPRSQNVTDAVTDTGLTQVQLPTTYPINSDGSAVTWQQCQPVGTVTLAAGLRGIFARSAAPSGTRELAWFPKARQAAKVAAVEQFKDWRNRASQ